jgi:prevent-host-death family protein
MWLEELLRRGYYSYMKKASISDAKNQLSALIDGVKAGGTVLIVDRGRPVARLEPVLGDTDDGGAGRLSRLVRAGIVRPAKTLLPRAVLAAHLPRARRGASALQTLIDERREGR